MGWSGRAVRVASAAVVGSALALSAPGVSVATPGSSPHRTAHVVLRLVDSDGWVQPGRTLFRGRVAGPRAGETVRIQKRSADGWHTVRRVSHSGDFAFRHPLPVGTHTLRAVVSHPAGRLESAPVTVGVRDLGGRKSYADCDAAYNVNQSHWNICAHFHNQTQMFTGPGQLGQGLDDTMTLSSKDINGENRIDCYDNKNNDAYYYHRVQEPESPIGSDTWAFCAANRNYTDEMTGVWTLTAPGAPVRDALSFDITSDNPPKGSCGRGTWFACQTDLQNTMNSGQYITNAHLNYLNAPVLVEVVNNTGQPVTWRNDTTPTVQRVQKDAVGSTSGTKGSSADPLAPGGSYFLAGYRQMTGANAVITMSLEFHDTSYTTIRLVHSVNCTLQIAPKKGSDGKLPDSFAVWEADYSGSACQDRPYGGSSSGMTVETAIDWSGNQWTNAITARVTLTNRN